MKQALLFFWTASVLLSCGSGQQSKAIEDQKKANEVLKTLEGESISTKNGDWVMTAKIDGKDWAATSFRSIDATDWINGDYKDESIKLPYYREYMVVGKKILFGENRMAQLFNGDDNVVFWGGQKGEMEITKVDGQLVEGKFFFTATAENTDKKIEVTDGFFRIHLSKQ